METDAIVETKMIDHRQRVYDEYERFFQSMKPTCDWRDAASVVIAILVVLVVYCWVAGA